MVTLVIVSRPDLIGQLSRDVVGRLSVLGHNVIGYEDS